MQPVSLDSLVSPVVIKPSEAFNKCGIRNRLLYLPAFKPRQDRTVDNVIPHWTKGLKSFFGVPKEMTYEWFGGLVREINEIDLENGSNSATHFVTRDGDSFIQNVLTPNVQQICQNVCVPRGNLDGSLIEMFMAGANMITSESTMKTWQALIKETIVKCSCVQQEQVKRNKVKKKKIQRVTAKCVRTILTVKVRALPIAAATHFAIRTLIRIGNNL
jgi:hypothetical protein